MLLFSRRVGRDALGDLPTDYLALPTAEGMRADEVGQVRTALAELLTELADVIWLKRFEDSTLVDISESPGIAVGAAKSGHYRGIRQLCRALAKVFQRKAKKAQSSARQVGVAMNARMCAPVRGAKLYLWPKRRSVGFETGNRPSPLGTCPAPMLAARKSWAAILCMQ